MVRNLLLCFHWASFVGVFALSACNANLADNSGTGSGGTTVSSATALGVNLTSAQVTPGQSQSFTASGGMAPFSWTLSSGTGSLSATSGATTSFSSSTSQNAQLRVTDSAGASILIPIRISSLVSRVTHGGWDGCGVLSGGGVKCWGYDSDGRLGDGTSGANLSSPESVVGLNSGVTAVTYGGGFGCAILTDQTVKCWGNNYYGSIGNGNPQYAILAPTAVAGLSSVVQIVAASYQVCARVLSGAVYCWGNNNYGQVGDGTTTQRNSPYAVPGITNAIDISVALSHTCAVLSDHTVQCWGLNSSGELGDLTTTSRYSPVVATGLNGVAKMALGRSHSCALFTDGTVGCWGLGNQGQLGYGNYNSSSTISSKIPGVSGVTLLAASGPNTCAANGSGVQCWGDQSSGALGSGAPATYATSFNTPQTVAVLKSGVTDLAIGPSQWGGTVLAVADGQVYSWGLNDQLQLGSGGTEADQNVPTLTAPF